MCSMRYSPRLALDRLVFCAALLCMGAIAFLGLLQAASAALGQPLGPVLNDQEVQEVARGSGLGVTYARTESPRDTLASLLRLKNDLEVMLGDRGLSLDRARSKRVALIAEELTSLVDLSQIPSASRREVGIETLGYLLDVLGRVELPELSNVPDRSAFDEEGSASYSIPETPFRIVRIEAGPREGEFLFSERTIRAAPRFYRSIESVPLRTTLGIESWSTGIRQITGPLIPAGLVAHLPEASKRPVFGTPLWKILAVGLVAAVAASLLVLWHRAIRRIARLTTLVAL